MTVSKNGVYYDLKSSPYYFEYKGLCFSFSSHIHRDKFIAKINIRTDWLTDSISRRFHFEIDMSLVAVLQLYLQTETRGFYIVDLNSGEEYTCKENLKLDGQKIKKKD